MKSLLKQLSLLQSITEQDVLPQHCNRIELKQVRSGHFRLYFALPNGATSVALKPITDIAEAQGLWTNLFPSNSHCTALQFIDPDEQAKQ